MLWHIWHKMLKQKDRGLLWGVSKHMPAIGKSSPGELTMDFDPFLSDSAATHLLWFHYNPQWLLLHTRLQGREIITLPSHHTAQLLSVWISALTISKEVL